MALSSHLSEDPQQPSTSTASEYFSRTEDNLRKFNLFFSEKTRVPLNLWSHCTTRQRGRSLKADKRAIISIKSVNFKELLDDNKDYLNDLARTCETTFHELCGSLRFLVYHNKVPLSSSENAAELLRYVASCIILHEDEWVARIDKNTMFDSMTSKLFGQLKLIETGGEESLQRWRDRLKIHRDEISVEWEIEPPESPYCAEKDEHLREVRVYEENYARDLKFNATYEILIEVVVRNNKAVREKQYELRDSQYYGDDNHLLLPQSQVLLDLPSITKVPDFMFPTFEDDGYFPSNCKNRGRYLLDKYEDAQKECKANFESFCNTVDCDKAPEKFEQSSFFAHELLHFHTIGRHIHGFFNVIVEKEHGWISAKGTRVRRRYMVELYHRMRFPLYVPWEAWPPGMKWAFDKISMYGIKLMHAIKNPDYKYIVPVKETSRFNDITVTPKIKEAIIDVARGKRKRRTRKDPTSEGRLNRPVVRTRKTIQAPRLPPGSTRKAIVVKDPPVAANAPVVPAPVPQLTVPTVSPRRKSSAAKRRHEESTAVSSPFVPIAPAPINLPVVPVPPVPVKKKKKDSWDEHESTFLEEHVDDGTGDTTMHDATLDEPMDRRGTLKDGVWVPTDRGGLIAPEQYAKEILEHYGVKKGEEDDVPEGGGAALLPQASASAPLPQPAAAFSIPPGPLADLVADISNEPASSPPTTSFSNHLAPPIPYQKQRRSRKPGNSKQQTASATSALSRATIASSAVLAEVLALTSPSTSSVTAAPSASSIAPTIPEEEHLMMPSTSSFSSTLIPPAPSAPPSADPPIQTVLPPTSSPSAPSVAASTSASNGHSHVNGRKQLAPVKRVFMNKPHLINPGAKPVYPVKKLCANPTINGSASSPGHAPRPILIGQQQKPVFIGDDISPKDQSNVPVRKFLNGTSDSAPPTRSPRPHILQSFSLSPLRKSRLYPNGTPSVASIIAAGPVPVPPTVPLPGLGQEGSLFEQMRNVACKCRRELSYQNHMDDHTIVFKKSSEPGWPNGKYHRIWDPNTRKRCLMPLPYRARIYSVGAAALAPAPDAPTNSSSEPLPKPVQRSLSNHKPSEEPSSSSLAPTVRPRSLSNQTQNGRIQRPNPVPEGVVPFPEPTPGPSAASDVPMNQSPSNGSAHTTPQIPSSTGAAAEGSPKRNVPWISQSNHRALANAMSKLAASVLNATEPEVSPESSLLSQTPKTTTTAYTFVDSQQSIVPNQSIRPYVWNLNRKTHTSLTPEELGDAVRYEHGRYHQNEPGPTIREVLQNLKNPLD